MSLLDALSGFALQRLPRERFLALRESYFGVRQRLFPLMRRVHGTFDAADLRRHLEEKVGRDYEILMVHSSMNHMLPMYTGTALDIVQMLVEYCGPERTLAMPAFFFGNPQLDDVAAFYQQSPVFDVRRTPSQMGMVTELFRRSSGVLQSLHPTHRIAARGPLAAELTRGHESAGTAFGRGTPFDFMARHETRIIGLGKPFEVLSQAHCVEDLLGDDFPVPARTVTVPMTLRDVDRVDHAFALHWRKFEWPRNMNLLRRIMDQGQLQEWSFHHVPLFAASAREVTDALMSAARRGVTLYEKRTH